MDFELLLTLSPYLFTLGLLALGFFAGTAIEKKHFREIQQREQAMRGLIAVNLRRLPEDWNAHHSHLVTGSVVVSLDYFKRFLAGLRGFFGGQVGSYETLLDRGRREATLRMKEAAQAADCNAVTNLRIETSKLASSRGDGNGVAGVEILVFGTGVKASIPSR